ncbi:hypothetical protein BDY24DRAFT_438481 [Mrakia frigida]|uniref:uncharacterized protein n=1 Tax=Mrakia frigida TaxID=29902 RepID=UPI003FCC2042
MSYPILYDKVEIEGFDIMQKLFCYRNPLLHQPQLEPYLSLLQIHHFTFIHSDGAASFEISRSPKRDGLKRNAVRELRGSGGTTPLLSLLGVKEMVVRVYSSRQKDRMEAKVLRGKDLEVVEAWKGRLKFEVGLNEHLLVKLPHPSSSRRTTPQKPPRVITPTYSPSSISLAPLDLEIASSSTTLS